MPGKENKRGGECGEYLDMGGFWSASCGGKTVTLTALERKEGGVVDGGERMRWAVA